ncbi:MAG: hypothetical protein ACRC5C_02920, partial [Bacilli bacterium]
VSQNGITRIVLTQILLYISVGIGFGVIGGGLLLMVFFAIDPSGTIILNLSFVATILITLLFWGIGRKIGRQSIVETLHTE